MNWEELLQIDDFNHEDLKRSINELMESETKGSAIKTKAKNFDFGQKLEVEEMISLLNDIGPIDNIDDAIDETKKQLKFPQANNITEAIIALEIIINESQPTDLGINSYEIADMLGFSYRQGNYYGDFLVYLGFLNKNGKYYNPTREALKYKQQSDRKERNKIIIKSMIQHESIREYFLLYYSTPFPTQMKDKFIDILKKEPLLKGFSDTTILRRKSTVDAMARWTNNIVKVNAKPFVKWAGGKQRIINVLDNYLPNKEEIKEYIEPFAGGAAMLYHIKPQTAIINDYNSELINAYIQIRDNVDELIVTLDQLTNSEQDFYRIRNVDRDKEMYSKYKDVEKAARFIYLNKTCFNGLYRVNKNGEFNTPYGHNPNAMFKIFEQLRENSDFYNSLNISFEAVDYKSVLSKAKNDSFVYLDPPYDPISKTSSFTAYTDKKFGIEEQIQLKEMCDILTRKGVKIMLSNSNTDFIKDLYNEDWYNVYEIEVRRSIASNVGSRKLTSELVVTNY